MVVITLDHFLVQRTLGEFDDVVPQQSLLFRERKIHQAISFRR
jgi:hypothetical protein